ncbi:MAG TPA: S1/P1 nuclease [Balneolales bacterium]|nr:S1/P1 nuclease [Balneolales bacterium]
MKSSQLRIKHYFLILVFVTANMIPVSSFAWGHEGHKIIADVATHYISKKAQVKLKKLLNVLHKQSLAQIANWADKYRETHPKTGPWHYVDIPLNAKTYNARKYCKHGDCIVSKLEHFEVELSDPGRSLKQRARALKFVVHFVGDIHQPLHCADNHDRGGNDVHVVFMGDSTNLHLVWDYGIIDQTGMNATQYANYLINNYAPSHNVNVTQIKKGSFIDWAMQSHKLAVQYAYGDKPQNNILTKKYYTECKPIVDQQLYDAGVRLAGVLNRMLTL